MTQKNTFISQINGLKFDVTDPNTVGLLSKNEKKDLVYKDKPKEKKGKSSDEMVIRNGTR